MSALWLFWLKSPLHLAVWLGNRFCAGVGVLAAWRKVKHHPNRVRRFLPWIIAINCASFAILFGFWWLSKSR